MKDGPTDPIGVPNRQYWGGANRASPGLRGKTIFRGMSMVGATVPPIFGSSDRSSSLQGVSAPQRGNELSSSNIWTSYRSQSEIAYSVHEQRKDKGRAQHQPGDVEPQREVLCRRLLLFHLRSSHVCTSGKAWLFGPSNGALAGGRCRDRIFVLRHQRTRNL